MSEVKTLFITKHGFQFEPDSKQPHEFKEMGLLVNGAILKIEWAKIGLCETHEGSYKNVECCKISFHNVKGPFGFLSEFPK